MLVGDHQNHPDHGEVAKAVEAAAAASDGVVYTYKTYVFRLHPYLRRALWRVKGTPEALRLKRSMIEAYSTIGAMSTPDLYEESTKDKYEYIARRYGD